MVVIPKGEYINLKKFEGTPFNSLVAMAYLNRKHKNNCVIIPIRNIPNDHSDLSIRWIQKKGEEGHLKIPKFFWSEFEKHLSHSHDKRFIVFCTPNFLKESGSVVAIVTTALYQSFR